MLVTSIAWDLPKIRRAEAGALPDLVELIPGNATFIAYADFGVLRSSPLAAYVGQSFTAITGTATADRDYASFVRATGFDYQRDLDRVALAAVPGSPNQTFVVADGRFDRAKIQQYALRFGQAENSEGHVVYVIPRAGAGKDVSITFLSANRIALLQGGGFSGLLTMAARPAFDSEMSERLSRIAGAPLFATAKAPASIASSNSSAAVAGKAFDGVRWITFAAQPGVESMFVSAEGECGTSREAAQIASALEVMRGILHAALADPKSRGQFSPEIAMAGANVLESVKIDAESSRVRMLLSLTPAMIRNLAALSAGTRAPAPR